MFSSFIAASETLLLIPIAVIASWAVRRGIRALMRQAVQRAQRSENSSWRVRLDRLGDDGQSDARKRQRADAVARVIGHVVTTVIAAITAVVGLNRLGVDAVFAISSAGFVGFAIAISAQDFVKDFLAGIRVLLEDRYAVGDVVTLVVGGNEVHGTVDLIGTASVRLRTAEGATWHAGHHVIESVTNESQLPTITGIDVPLAEWTQADADAAPSRLAEASNDVGLTGVVFVRDIETHTPTDADRPTTADPGPTARLVHPITVDTGSIALLAVDPNEVTEHVEETEPSRNSERADATERARTTAQVSDRARITCSDEIGPDDQIAGRDRAHDGERSANTDSDTVNDLTDTVDDLTDTQHRFTRTDATGTDDDVEFPTGESPLQRGFDDDRTVTVAVKSNRPLSASQAELVRDRLLGH